MTPKQKAPVENTTDRATDREIVITRTFDAPRELVWEAMTDSRHVVNWWGPRGFSTTIEKMDFRVGGIWKLVMHGPDGANYPNEQIFQEIVKPERIVLAHSGRREGGPGVTSVKTWTFDEVESGKTKVTIRMVFSSATERDFVVKEFGAIEGGKQTLERLGEQLAKAICKPFVISREFSAPRELVWQAWTDREHLKHWFGPHGCAVTTATLDFRPGGTFHYATRMADGKEMWGKFFYREIVPPHKVVLINCFSDAAGGMIRHPFHAHWPLEMLHTTTLVERDGKTLLTIEWVPFNATDEERRCFDGMREGMTQGWTGTFKQLEEYLKGQTFGARG
jgi:uncharacterized protein YndB with AHSA1/START domain